MNKKFIPILIFLLTAAMVGLIVIQVIWINQGIKVRKERFDQNVHEAMNAVSGQLEHKLALKKMESYDPLMADRWFKDMIRKLNADLGATAFTEDSSAKLDLTFQFQKTDQGYNRQITQKITISDSSEERRIEVVYDTSEKVIDNSSAYKAFQSNFHRYNSMLQKIAWKMTFDQIPLQKKIKEEDLRDLIDGELLNRGITAKYNYAVIGSGGNPMNFVFTNFTKPAVDENTILESYKSRLMNDNLFNSSILMLHFPKKTNYILSTMWLMLSASAFFILIIMLCFIASIHIILKQKKLSDLKNDFINNMTHELKTPVATISLASEMLQKDQVIDDKNRIANYSGIIHSENQRLRTQIDKVLQAARLDRGQIDLNKQKVDIHSLLREVKDRLYFRIKEEEGELIESLDAAQSEVLADKDHIISVFNNLLDNAIKYRNGQLKIDISTRNIGQNLQVKIKDNGIGMSRDELKKIFEKFYRVPTGNLHDTKGFGLGLSYVKRMVDLHDGSIQVESELHKGSTFIVNFPLITNTSNGKG